MRRSVVAALAVMLAAAAVLAPGCGTASISNPSTIVRRAIEAQGRLKSVGMKMDGSVKVTGSPDAGGVMSSFYRAEGSFEQPDRSRVLVRSSTGETEVITIGDRAYVKKSPGTGTWVRKKVSGAPASGASPADVTNYLKYTTGLELVDRREGTYRLRFNLDMGRYAKVSHLPGVDPSAFKGMQARMEVWVVEGSFYVKRAKMEFDGDLSRIGVGSLDMSVDIEFSDFNRPVGIEAPVSGTSLRISPLRESAT